jgi:hypothetical protein
MQGTISQRRPRHLSFLLRLTAQRCLKVRLLLVFLVLCYVMNHVKVLQELSSLDSVSLFPGPSSSTLTTMMNPASATQPHQKIQQQFSFLFRNTTETTTVKQQQIITSSLSSSSLPYIVYDRPFEEMRDAMDAGNDTVGQYLLDFGIIGFPKCGTTTMMRWLGSHPEIAAIQHEIMALQRHHPARLLNYIMKELPEGQYQRGYKSPNDVEDLRALHKLSQHYPQTKLIVGIRHPVLWFESFYNHRIQNGMTMPKMIDMKQGCQAGYHGVCIGRAGFHNSLVRMGKTLLGYDDNHTSTKQERDKEWHCFSNKEQRLLRNDLPVHLISPNPVFLYDISQLNLLQHRFSDSSSGQQQPSKDLFVEQFKTYLGVSNDFPPMIQSKPGKKDLNVTEQAQRNAHKVNICDAEYQQVRQWLLESGKRTKEWILGYFIKSPDVMVGNIKQFQDILEMYDVDPCLQRPNQHQTN